MKLFLRPIPALAALFVVSRLGLCAQVSMPIDGFESVGLAFSILEHPTSGALYLPSVLHGTLESVDNGRTWKAVDSSATFASYKQSNTLVWENDTTMYARVVDGYGYVSQIVSADLGRTWKKRATARLGIQSLSILADGTVIDEYRFDVSTNFGRTWKRVEAAYDSAAFHYPAILVAPHVAAVWDTRGNWYEVDCINDTAIRHRMKDRTVFGYHLFADGSYIAIASDSWRWYSKNDSLVRKQVDTVINGNEIALAGSKLVTTGERWIIVTRNAWVFDATQSDITLIGQPSSGVARTLVSAVVRDKRIVITSNIGTGAGADVELADYNPETKTFRIGVRARKDMIGDAVFLSTITRSGTPIILTNSANIIRYDTQTGDWTNSPVTPLTIAPVNLAVVGAIPTTGTPGYALVTSTMQPYRLSAPGEFVFDTTPLPAGSFALRSVGHILRTSCHRIIATPTFLWLNGYDFTGTSRSTGADTLLCRDCQAYLESSAGLIFSGTKRVLRRNPKSVAWDTLTIDTSLSIEKTGYVSDLVESTVHNTIVVGRRGYDAYDDGLVKNSVVGGLSWTNDLGDNWYFSESDVPLSYIHSLTRVGNIVYAIGSNAAYSPTDLGPDKDVGAMIVDTVAILRSIDGGYTFKAVHVIHERRALHMQDLRVIAHNGLLYACLQNQRIYVSTNGMRWDEDIDQPLPQGSILSLTPIGDSVMILATTKGAFILDRNTNVGVESPAWQPLTALRYNTFDNSISILQNLGNGTLVVADLHGRIVDTHEVNAFTSHIPLLDLPTGIYGATFMTDAGSYRLLLHRTR